MSRAQRYEVFAGFFAFMAGLNAYLYAAADHDPFNLGAAVLAGLVSIHSSITANRPVMTSVLLATCLVCKRNNSLPTTTAGSAA